MHRLAASHLDNCETTNIIPISHVVQAPQRNNTDYNGKARITTELHWLGQRNDYEVFKAETVTPGL